MKISKFLTWLFPVACQYCGALDTYVCDRCYEVFYEVNPEDTVLGDSGCIVSVGYVYNKAIEYILEEAKTNGYYGMASYLGELWGREIRKDTAKYSFISSGDTIFVPIPLSKEKQRKRGFNQVDLILQGLNSKLGSYNRLEVKHLLMRTRDTQTQVGMNKQQRQRNLSSAFSIQKVYKHVLPDMFDKQIVLVDDVFTTGTTINECANVLKTAGFKNVQAMVFAKG